MFKGHNPKKNLLKDKKALATLAKAGITIGMIKRSWGSRYEK